MAGKYFGIPFALSGDRTAIPDAAQPDGSVSFTQGFTLDYELENTDPNYKPVPREETNALYYDITEAIGIVQKQGFADWTLSAAPYPINAFVRHNDIVWRNALAGNSAEPGTDATWVNETIPATDFLNTQRIDVASASTIDLTAVAPNTRHIRITGTTTINSFTVAAGQCYFVTFSSALTLANSASLVTNTGASIVTQSGGFAIIEATAANVVSVTCIPPMTASAADGTKGRVVKNGDKQVCDVMINFNGTGVIAIRDSYNVAGIVDNGTGNYTVNFSTTMANANYAAVANGNVENDVSAATNCNLDQFTTTSIRITCRGTANPQDQSIVSMLVFGER